MRQAPTDLDVGVLAAALLDRWRFNAQRLEYVAIGGGSHHWRAEAASGERVWLSVDDLDDKPFLGRTRPHVFDALRTALETAHTLRNQHGLGFVMAPQPARGGDVLVRITQPYTMAVYPFVDGHSFPFGQPLPPTESDRLLQMLVRLHQATPAVETAANRADLNVSERTALEIALTEAHAPWSGGPYAEAARAVVSLRMARINRLLARFDALAATRIGPHLITHGEPHPANLLATDAGALLLLDWDTSGLAPPERDLCWLDPDQHAEYTRKTGRPVDPAGVELYRLRWFLDDLAYAVKRLRSADTPMAEAQLAWDWLERTQESSQWMS